jgi:hypothetical protein
MSPVVINAEGTLERLYFSLQQPIKLHFAGLFVLVLSGIPLGYVRKLPNMT